jgi:hypothetical protein
MQTTNKRCDVRYEEKRKHRAYVELYLSIPFFVPAGEGGKYPLQTGPNTQQRIFMLSFISISLSATMCKQRVPFDDSFPKEEAYGHLISVI